MLTNSQIIDKFIAENEIAVAENTLNNYKIALQGLLNVAHEVPFCREHVLKSMAEMKKKGNNANTIRQRITVVQMFMRWGEEMGYIKAEQSAKIKLPAKEEKIVNMLNKDETRVLLNSDTPSVMHNKLRNKILMQIFIYSGSRVSAVCALTPGDINFYDNSITFRKTKRNKEHIAFIEQELADDIREYIDHVRSVELNEHDPLFVGERKVKGKWQQISRQGLYNVTKSYTEKVTGNSASPHELRHTSASIQLDQGVDIDIIQDNLAHAQLNTTKTYAQRFDNNTRREQTLRAFANL